MPINLGTSELIAGMSFLCLSRAKHVVNLLLESMPFEILSTLDGKGLYLLLRLVEEKRFRSLAAAIP